MPKRSPSMLRLRLVPVGVGLAFLLASTPWQSLQVTPEAVALMLAQQALALVLLESPSMFRYSCDGPVLLWFAILPGACQGYGVLSFLLARLRLGRFLDPDLLLLGPLYWGLLQAPSPTNFMLAGLLYGLLLSWRWRKDLLPELLLTWLGLAALVDSSHRQDIPRGLASLALLLAVGWRLRQLSLQQSQQRQLQQIRSRLSQLEQQGQVGLQQQGLRQQEFQQQLEQDFQRQDQEIVSYLEKRSDNLLQLCQGLAHCSSASDLDQWAQRCSLDWLAIPQAQIHLPGPQGFAGPQPELLEQVLSQQKIIDLSASRECYLPLEGLGVLQLGPTRGPLSPQELSLAQELARALSLGLRALWAQGQVQELESWLVEGPPQTLDLEVMLRSAMGLLPGGPALQVQGSLQILACPRKLLSLLVWLLQQPGQAQIALDSEGLLWPDLQIAPKDLPLAQLLAQQAGASLQLPRLQFRPGAIPESALEATG